MQGWENSKDPLPIDEIEILHTRCSDSKAYFGQNATPWWNTEKYRPQEISFDEQTEHEHSNHVITSLSFCAAKSRKTLAEWEHEYKIAISHISNDAERSNSLSISIAQFFSVPEQCSDGKHLIKGRGGEEVSCPFSLRMYKTNYSALTRGTLFSYFPSFIPTPAANHDHGRW